MRNLGIKIGARLPASAFVRSAQVCTGFRESSHISNLRNYEFEKVEMSLNKTGRLLPNKE
jgi:hypothetical protein